MVKQGVLLSNERLKLYKKPSTWILMGVIVSLTLLGLILSRFFVSLQDRYSPKWQDQYNSSIEEYKTMLNENPDDIDLAQSVESIKYLLENKIPPQDWRTDVVIEYYSFKAAQLIGEKTGKYTDPRTNFDYENEFFGNTNLTKEQIADRLAKLQGLLDSKDWHEYVRLKIDDLKSGWTKSRSDQEKQVNIEMYELYLSNKIEPVADLGNNPYYWGGFSDSSIFWKSEQIESIRQNKLNLLRGEDLMGNILTNSRVKTIEKDIEVSLKRLSTNIAPITYDSFMGQFENTATSISLLSVLLIVYAANIFASEYTSGTVKLLLITPHKRKRIFWAKTILMVELSVIALAANFILAFLISGSFTAFRGIDSMQVMHLFGNVVQLPYLLYILLKYLVMMLPVLTYGALAMMMSVITRKSAISIAVTMVLMFGSDIIISIITMFSGSFVIPGIKFLLFANTSLEVYLPSALVSMTGLTGQTVDPTMTLGFSVAVLLVYMVCFLWIARDSFCRRDVK